MSWFACRVEDLVGFFSCFKCQEFGNVAKFCRGKEVCRHCGVEGHQAEGSPSRGVAAICPLCKERKVAHDHVPGSRECGTYLRGVIVRGVNVDSEPPGLAVLY